MVRIKYWHKLNFVTNALEYKQFELDRPDPLAQPNTKKDIFTQKISYIFLQKSIFKRKIFSRTFERTDHLADPPSRPQKNHFLA